MGLLRKKTSKKTERQELAKKTQAPIKPQEGRSNHKILTAEGWRRLMLGGRTHRTSV